MSKMLDVTGDAVTQVIQISDGDGGAVALYPASVPYLVSQLMQAAVMLGLEMHYPAAPQTVEFTKN